MFGVQTILISIHIVCVGGKGEQKNLKNQAKRSKLAEPMSVFGYEQSGVSLI